MTDARYAYGVNCVWWDHVSKVGIRAPALPCCPHCGSMLFEVAPEVWERGVDAYERAGHAGYRAFTDWRRGRCYPNQPAAYAAFVAATGKTVENPP